MSIIAALALQAILDTSPTAARVWAEVAMDGSGINPTEDRWKFTLSGTERTRRLVLELADGQRSPPGPPKRPPAHHYASTDCPAVWYSAFMLQSLAVNGARAPKTAPATEMTVISARLSFTGFDGKGPPRNLEDGTGGELALWTLLTREAVKACPEAAPE